VYSPFPAAPSKINDDSARQNQFGIYSAINVNTAQNINLEAGGRFNHHSVYGNNFAFNINPSYLYQSKLKVFANLSTGYKTPSLFQLYSEYGNSDLEPETSLNLEGGLQYFSTNKKAQVRFTYFDRKVEDVIAFFYNPATFQSQYINQDKQKDNGFEVDAKWDLSDKVNMKFFYSHIDGEITTKTNGKDTSYFNLIRRPKNSFSLTVGSKPAKKLYVSTQLQAFGTRKDIYFDPVTFEQNDITLDNYILISFYTEYSFFKNRLKLFADLRNITDEDYREIYGYNTPGFNAYAGIRAVF
jgi:vitamin B12 transporter